MAERVAGVLGGDGERKHARAPAVSDDDLGLARVAVPLERDHVAGIVACVEFHKHAWLLSGSGVAYGCGQRDLMAPTLRFLVRDRARGHAWCCHGTDDCHTGGAAGFRWSARRYARRRWRWARARCGSSTGPTGRWRASTPTRIRSRGAAVSAATRPR